MSREGFGTITAADNDANATWGRLGQPPRPRSCVWSGASPSRRLQQAGPVHTAPSPSHPLAHRAGRQDSDWAKTYFSRGSKRWSQHCSLESRGVRPCLALRSGRRSACWKRRLRPHRGVSLRSGASSACRRGTISSESVGYETRVKIEH